MFRVTAANDRDNPRIAATTTGAWKQVYDCVASRRTEMKLQPKTRDICGHVQFGLKSAKIMKLIEQLPGAAECKNYIPLSKRRTNKKKASDKPKPKSGTEFAFANLWITTCAAHHAIAV